MVGEVLVSAGENNILRGQLQMYKLLHDIKDAWAQTFSRRWPGQHRRYGLASMLSSPGIKYHSLVALSARRMSRPTCGGLQSIAFLYILAQNIFEVAAGGGEM